MAVSNQQAGEVAHMVVNRVEEDTKAEVAAEVVFEAAVHNVSVVHLLLLLERRQMFVFIVGNPVTGPGSVQTGDVWSLFRK